MSDIYILFSNFVHNVIKRPLRNYEYFSFCADAFDTQKLLHCLESLKRGCAVEIPNYDFRTHKNNPPARKVCWLWIKLSADCELNLYLFCVRISVVELSIVLGSQASPLWLATFFI